MASVYYRDRPSGGPSAYEESLAYEEMARRSAANAGRVAVPAGVGAAGASIAAGPNARASATGGGIDAAYVSALLPAGPGFGGGGRYAKEERPSKFAYAPFYRGPLPIVSQIKKLADVLSLDPAHALDFAVRVLPDMRIPAGAEGMFAIPKADALAERHFPFVTNTDERYCRAVELVLDKIGASRQLLNGLKGEVTSDRLHVCDRTALAFELLGMTQKGGILVVHAQLGLRHRGKSVRRSCETFAAGEFGLGSLAVSSVVLVHPERIYDGMELDMICAGDEFGFDAAISSSHVPIIYFGGEIGYGLMRHHDAHEYYGSVSAFIP